MQTTKQQQIVIYFIEEAKEHLDTIEQNLLSLQATMDDPERLNELFRAAHSVKGGAAMLGFASIQKVGHHLEDSFKLLKENAVRVDQQLETLFLQGFDVLKHLVTELQSPYGLQDQDADRILQAAAPMFVELERYLQMLIRGESVGVKAPAPKAIANLPAVLNAALKQMLDLFKQGDTPDGRQKLVALCGKMRKLHSGPQWQALMQVASQALLAESPQSGAAAASVPTKVAYKVLAPLLIKELKQAGELLITGRAEAIVPSPALQKLAGVSPTQVPETKAMPSSPSEVMPGPSTTAKPAQIIIPAEPRAAARVLLGAFNKNQLIELAEYLMKAIQ